MAIQGDSEREGRTERFPLSGDGRRMDAVSGVKTDAKKGMQPPEASRLLPEEATLKQPFGA